MLCIQWHWIHGSIFFGTALQDGSLFFAPVFLTLNSQVIFVSEPKEHSFEIVLSSPEDLVGEWGSVTACVLPVIEKSLQVTQLSPSSFRTLDQCQRLHKPKQYRHCKSSVNYYAYKQISLELVAPLLSCTLKALVAGDIAINPGPGAGQDPTISDTRSKVKAKPKWKHPCKSCCKPVRDNQRGIQCDGCDIWWHQKCTVNVSEEKYHELANSSKPWYCSKCLTPQFADPRGNRPFTFQKL